VTIACPKCEEANAAHDVICSACAALLYPKHYSDDLSPSMDELIKQAHFDTKAILILLHEESDYRFEVHPQAHQYDLKVGRYAKGDHQLLDVNLGKLGDKALGVSRFHTTIHYDKKTETLQLFDMGSTNGTFVNEQRLHVNERRILRGHDVIRFGRLEVQTIFHIDE
jgi:FHA domain